jgi:phosphoribosylformimino-5-aminoimidazole carboxamide ribotide isomerase
VLIIPAIDLIDGKCVRLTQGDFNQKKVYGDDPLGIALFFKNTGAKRIHIIDLDGAKTGKSKNRDIIKKIKKETGLIIETGGGIRTEHDVEELIYGGIDYLILGSILIHDIKSVEKWINKFGRAFIAGIDARGGKVQSRGWMNDEGLDAVEFGRKMAGSGFDTAVYTDISRDGNLQGINLKQTIEFAKGSGMKVILSGGVTSADDILKASSALDKGIIGVIIGKAFYEGKIDLNQIIKEYQD